MQDMEKVWRGCGMSGYINERVITGSVRYKTYMKRGKMYSTFRVSIFNPIIGKQISKEFAVGKHGPEAREMAVKELNIMRDKFAALGYKVSYDDMHRAPMPNWLTKKQEQEAVK